MSECIYIEIPSQDVGMFRFLLEAWDNLALATTLDPGRAVLKVRYAPGSAQLVASALKDMSRAIDFKILRITG